ncbi:hypothetical protein BD560DRAFT_326231, partial [Blakeslea trispora]
SIRIMLHLTKVPFMKNRLHFPLAQFLSRFFHLPFDTLLSCLFLPATLLSIVLPSLRFGAIDSLKLPLTIVDPTLFSRR